ncbi:MAG: Maf family protein [Spirochaetaceae bacterium]|nr:Maf family protein [Spirochaetaceae bacterium]
METLILASASPRRQELLKTVGIPFRAAPSNIDETINEGEGPKEAALRLAGGKINAFLQNERSIGCHWVIAADTFIYLDGAIYGKANSRDDAEQLLKKLSMRRHQVYTGLAVYNRGEGRTVTTVEVTEVEFLRLTPEDIDWYLDSGEWQDAAGSYKIQGKAQVFIKAVHGSVSNVMGLPLHRLYAILKELNYKF